MTAIRKELEANNYVVLEDFIPPQRAKDLYDHFIAHKNEWPELFHRDDQCPRSLATYNYKLFLVLLVEKVGYMTDKMGQVMLPTYCYARAYKNGEVLEKHTDRPACEISVTLHLGGDHTWPIWFTKPDGSKVSCELKPGQAVMYQGMVSEHWRDAYEGKEYAQVFLHYVKSDGDNWDHYFDKKEKKYE